MIEIQLLIDIAKEAGTRILSIYHQPAMEVTDKADGSPLTQADMASHHYISHALQQYYPEIPIISEESADLQNYETRKDWAYFFLVDPLDGTKEFVKRNGEFTVNIALVHNGFPVAGVIYAPALDVLYHAAKGKGAYKVVGQDAVRLSGVPQTQNPVRIVMSRSHPCADTEKFVQSIEASGKNVSATSAGSALKFGLVAENKADIYPRFVPTMEWDTAAGQILVEEVGKKVKVVGGEQPLRYNKQSLVNPGFVVE